MEFKFSRSVIPIAISIAVVGLMLFMNIKVDPPVGEAEGWFTSTSNGKYVGTDYSTGYVRKYVNSNPAIYYLYRSNYIDTYDETVRNGYYKSRCWFEFDLPSLDDKAGLGEDTFVYLYRSAGYSQNVDLYLLDYDPDSVSTQDKFEKIDDSYKIGAAYVSSTATTVTFSDTAREYLQKKIRNGDSVGHIGMVGNGGYITRFMASSCYVRMYYDNRAPDMPSILLPNYVNSVELPLTWSAVTDNPSPGTGDVQYQIGYFESASSSTPYFSTEWTSDTSMTLAGLQDGKEYTMRIRARDGNGYETAWSPYDVVEPDVSPPTPPLIFEEPLYTNGTRNTINWSSAVDAGIGVSYYGLIFSTSPDFFSSGSAVTWDLYYDHPSLVSGTTYYYVVVAVDGYLQQSGYSSITSTTMDADPPTTPVLMSEPPYTKGEENTFEWHPAIDDGIGIGHYKIQVATSYNFNPGSIVFDIDTNETQASFDSLEDDTQYYARVMAADKFHHDSDWSEVEWSIQDHKGPGELGLTPLMEYLPAGPVPLEWEGAEDNGSGVAYYEVLWSTDPLFVSNVHNRDHVLGQSFSIPEMTTDITWHIKVRAYDSLGNPGEEETTSTTLDSRPPTQPVIVPLETHTGGRTTTLTWSESTDALSGLDHYLIEVYTGADMVGLAFSAHTTDTEFEIPGLSDGTTYHYKVTAYDRAGNRIESAMVSSIQDNRGPDTPSFLPIDTLQPTGLFRVEWGPSSDASGEEVEYQVQWASNVVFTEDITESSWLTGTNYQVSDLPAATRAGEEVKEPLPDGEYYVRVRSRDRFDQMSSFGNAVRIIVDTTAPSVPILHELPVYSGGTSVHVSWAPSVDMAAGDMEYQVLVLENETGEPIMFTAWTMSEDIEVTGLLADMTYYFKVVSRDGLGWASEPSDAEMTTMDVNGPLVTIDNRGVFGGTDMYLKGLVKDTGCGVGKVEVSFDRGQTWKECTTVMDQWSYPMNADPSDSTEFLVRGHDKGGNIGVATSGSIDHNEPVVTILYPAESDRISGLTQITGSISDEHLSSYRVEYKRPGVEEWTAIIPEQTTSSISGILATWAPSGISGGEYILKVTGTDALDQETSKTINVTLAGAILSIDPSQLTFSNYNPLPGEKVAVMVAISNFGDSQAEDVTVKLYDDGEEIYSETGVTVPANGIITISATMKAEGKHSITARATSTLYDTGEMANGATIETMEEEMILENFGGIVGIIALILALIALILAFVLKGKKKEEAEIKEEKASEEKERPKKAVPMEMPKPQIEKPMLPESPVQEIKQPQLSTPTVAPSSAPATAPQSAPQLNAAPPMTPEQNGFMAAPAAESDKPQVNMPNN